MDFAEKVLNFLKTQEPWRPDFMHLYSPDQVRKAILAVENGYTSIEDVGAKKRA